MSVDQSFDQKKIGEGSLTISPFYKKEQVNTKVNCLGKHSLAKYVIFLSSEVTGYTFRGFVTLPASPPSPLGAVSRWLTLTANI